MNDDHPLPAPPLSPHIGRIEVTGQDAGVVDRWVRLIRDDPRTAELAQNIGPMMGMLGPLVGVVPGADYDSTEASDLLDGMSECWALAKAAQ